MMEWHGESQIAMTMPTMRDERSGRLVVPNSPVLEVPRVGPRQFCLSCGSHGELITALPRIGCLPDGSYSRTDVRDIRGDDRMDRMDRMV